MTLQTYALILLSVLAAAAATLALMSVAGTAPAALALAALGGAALLRLLPAKRK